MKIHSRVIYLKMKRAELICHLKLTYCTSLICFPQILIGCSFSYSSTLLTQLRESSSTIKLNTDEESWITSVAMLPCSIGLIVTGILLDKIGRKKALQVMYISIILSWVILTFADSYKTILVARILLGIAFGMNICMVLYVAEVCPANLRIVYMSMIPVCTGVGMMLECVLAMYLHWQTISAALFVAGVITFLMLFSVPESPMWLRSKGRNGEADNVDKWFDLKHVDTTVVGEPLENLINKTSGCMVDEQPTSYWSLYLQPNVWKPMIVTVVFFVVQQFSGLYVLLFYSGDLLRYCRIPGNVSVLLSVARILGSLSFTMCHRVKRRTLVAVSGGSMAASLIVVVAYTNIFRHDEIPPYQLIPITSFFIFMYFGVLGVLPIPWLLCAEVFPLAIRGVVSGIVQAFGYLLWFAVCKMYPWTVSTFGVEIVWSAFSLFCVLNVLYAIFIMPETQGKTLDQVLMYFESPKRN